jgi:hypothetical protein
VLVGHFAFGLAVKRADPQISLGTLALAAMLADFLWCLFMLAGVEHVRFNPGVNGAANYLTASNIVMSHSLATGAVWGALVAGGFFLWRRDTRGAWLLFAAVLSHWVLDVVSHRPDMPLAPGVEMRLGLGLWTSVPATLLVEGGAWAVALVVYARATQPRSRIGVYALWIGAALLTLIWYNNIAGPPPPNPRTAPIGSFLFFTLAVCWTYWINRLRPSCADGRQERPARRREDDQR